MLVVDTNVLLYAADRDSEFNSVCRSYLEAMRVRATPTYLSWNVGSMELIVPVGLSLPMAVIVG